MVGQTVGSIDTNNLPYWRFPDTGRTSESAAIQQQLFFRSSFRISQKAWKRAGEHQGTQIEKINDECSPAFDLIEAAVSSKRPTLYQTIQLPSSLYPQLSNKGARWKGACFFNRPISCVAGAYPRGVIPLCTPLYLFLFPPIPSLNYVNGVEAKAKEGRRRLPFPSLRILFHIFLISPFKQDFICFYFSFLFQLFLVERKQDGKANFKVTKNVKVFLSCLPYSLQTKQNISLGFNVLFSMKPHKEHFISDWKQSNNSTRSLLTYLLCHKFNRNDFNQQWRVSDYFKPFHHTHTFTQCAPLANSKHVPS